MVRANASRSFGPESGSTVTGIMNDIEDPIAVDGPATDALRAELRAARKTPIPDVVWDDDGSPTPFPDRAEPGR